ncbi:hypothetical protein Dda_2652 [Drechslerella dactyloides]|uniref:Uncharacterized protein n=1 Tax=Drechslerella dactyloides TaxID=74499 RepID=A0AAD6IZW3_DREDA|nr:hypothetical protein Dda_2652 [Drechslerella dactyloides]
MKTNEIIDERNGDGRRDEMRCSQSGATMIEKEKAEKQKFIPAKGLPFLFSSFTFQPDADPGTDQPELYSERS